jgi:CubicO group peptidase (beta-lactamase class C family)
MEKTALLQRHFLSLILPLVFLFPLLILAQEQEKQEKPDPPQTIEELKIAIEKIMEETKTPAVGVALVDENGPVWIAGLGKADVERDLDANENTMFRIGSVSKMFVALAILKLQEEGRVSLKDKVRDLVPEIWFENKWEDTNPILLEHLLEHTTGWHDESLAEYAHNDSIPISLWDGLNYRPRSRTSRWMPGTRMAYSNLGTPVAAYIVEKITGQSFEDYVLYNLFQPMGMENMTYFYSDTYNHLRAILYENGKPQKYWHIITRPSGSINASPNDMAKMVRFFINRGMVDSVPVVNNESMIRMETSFTTLGFKLGLEDSYGLCNFPSSHKGFVYRSHSGYVAGALTELSYLPDYDVGYAFMMNSGNHKAFHDISELIREFQTKDFDEQEIKADSELTEAHAAISGYYQQINPRMQISYFLDKILSVRQIRCSEDTVFIKGVLGGESIKYLPAGENRYKSSKTGLISMANVEDPLAGEVVQTGWLVLKQISPIQVFGQFLIIVLWGLMMLSAIILGLIWPIRYWKGRILGGVNIRVRLWPLVATLFFLPFYLIFEISSILSVEQLGNVSPVSLTIMLTTIGFALASVWSVFCIIKERKTPMNRWAYWHSAILSVLHLIATSYLLWYGVIGLRTWA